MVDRSAVSRNQLPCSVAVAALGSELAVIPTRLTTTARSRTNHRWFGGEWSERSWPATVGEMVSPTRWIAACAAAVGLFLFPSCKSVDRDGQRAEWSAAQTTLRPEPPGGSRAAQALGLAVCEPDARELEADPSFYADQPIPVGLPRVMDDITAWAEMQPGYAGVWIDRDQHDGWFSVGFSEGVADRQADLEEVFPGYQVVAVAVPLSKREGDALFERVKPVVTSLRTSAAMSPPGASGQLRVEVPVLDGEVLAALAPFAGTVVCVTGLEPKDATPDHPQPTGGDGWRLLAVDANGSSGRTVVATTDLEYRALWDHEGLIARRPAVDFQSEIVVLFGAKDPAGCHIRMDDVVVDRGQRLVYGNFVVPGDLLFCNSFGEPTDFVVAIERSSLPSAPFAIQLDAEPDADGAVRRDRTVVEVNLRRPGSTIS